MQITIMDNFVFPKTIQKEKKQILNYISFLFIFYLLIIHVYLLIFIFHLFLVVTVTSSTG